MTKSSSASTRPSAAFLDLCALSLYAELGSGVAGKRGIEMCRGRRVAIVRSRPSYVAGFAGANFLRALAE